MVEEAMRLRPSMPDAPDEQLRWLLQRQTEAMLTLASSVDQLRDELGTLSAMIASLTATVQAHV